MNKNETKQVAAFLSPHLGPKMNILQRRVPSSRITQIGVNKATACFTLYMYR